MPGVQESVVAGAGHVPMYDNPEAVVAQILAVTGAVNRGGTTVRAVA